VSAAEDGLRSAQEAAGQAEADLGAANVGASAVDLRQADNEVAAAQRAVDDAKSSHASRSEIANLQDELALAQLRRQQLDVPADTSAQRAAVDAAYAQVRQAEEDLAAAREGALTFLPTSEVLYLSDLPRRVDGVNVSRGSVLEGAAMTVSGATVRLTAAAAEADAKLLEVGAKASFELADGEMHPAKVVSVAPGEEDAEGRWSIELEPAPLTVEQMQQIQGSNVRVSIPVGATDGEVLSVPAAALSAGAGGEARVEVVEGDPRDPDAETRMVTVETGLAADGAVEITPVDGDLAEGDLVVVGK
jgi:multidrug efflux pump subunit AcrA (membrane-fusion protein)